MVRIRSAIPILALALAALAGCGGSSSGGGSTGSGLADLAPPGSLVFVEGRLQPSGELKASVDAIAKRVAGIDDLGKFVVSELERSAGADGEALDFAAEVEPWLGEEGGVAFERLRGGKLSEPLIAVQTSDPGAARAFVEKRTAKSRSPSKDVSYEGVRFQVGGSEDRAVGVIGRALVIADSEGEFKKAVDASQGESLGGEDRFQQTVAAASKDSLADVYVDLGGIAEQSKEGIDPQARQLLQSAGIETEDATAVASVIPQSERIEVEVSSALGGARPPAGDASQLLGSLPADSLAAYAFAGFGAQLVEALDSLDQEGAPPNLEPGELKSTLSKAGIDIDEVAASLKDGAVFIKGSDRASLGGALIATAKSGEAAAAVAGLGTLLRSAQVPGVTAVSGGISGFSIRNPGLGGKSLVVIGKGDRVAIGYGLPEALAGLEAGRGGGATLADQPDFKAAVAALGKTPISGFVDGPAALQLARGLVPRSKTEFWDAVPYLGKVTYVGIGAGASDELATAKLIAGVAK